MHCVGAAARKLHVCSLMKNLLVKGVQLNMSHMGMTPGAELGWGAALWGAMLGRGGVA